MAEYNSEQSMRYLFLLIRKDLEAKEEKPLKRVRVEMSKKCQK